MSFPHTCHLYIKESGYSQGQQGTICGRTLIFAFFNFKIHYLNHFSTTLYSSDRVLKRKEAEEEEDGVEEEGVKEERDEEEGIKKKEIN